MCTGNAPPEQDRCKYLEWEQPVGLDPGEQGYCRCTSPQNPAMLPIHPQLDLIADCTQDNCNTAKCPGIITGIFAD